MPLKIGRFQLKQKIGAGATSSVYLADDPFANREVAIKVAYPDVFRDPVHGPQFRKMFLNEAALAGKLRHPHIVALYDAGVEDEFHYIVMEYVSGGTLERLTTPGGAVQAYDKTVEMAFKCCKALEYAEREGVIHRDIKPANILLTAEQDIRISDFGAALQFRSDRTQVSAAVGSPRYMAPEQIKGEGATSRSDMYSVGVMLYELLTRTPLFTAENEFALLRKVVHEEPARLSRLRPDVPPALAEIVDRALAKDPAARFGSWGEFAEALSGVYAPQEARGEGVSETRRFNTLKKLSFFRSFSEQELWEFVRVSQWRRFQSGRTILEEGKVGSSFFIIASGEVRVLKGGKLLGVLNPGDCFGEMAHIQEEARPRSATVATTKESVIIKVKASALSGASDNLQLRINRVFLKILAERLARTDFLLASL